jgi:acetylxylan esterase
VPIYNPTQPSEHLTNPPPPEQVSTANQAAAWNSTCAQGSVIASAQYWANTVKAMYPGYSGTRPRFQVYHGSVDTTLRPQNYQETVKEWTGVFGFDATKPAKSQQNFPLNGYKTDTWGVSTANPLGTVQGIYATGVGHTVPIQGYVGKLLCVLRELLADFFFVNSAQDMKWFGLA